MSADLDKMASAFNTTISGLEDELMTLILSGQIQARIDSHNKVSCFCRNYFSLPSLKIEILDSFKIFFMIKMVRQNSLVI